MVVHVAMKVLCCTSSPQDSFRGELHCDDLTSIKYTPLILRLDDRLQDFST